MAEPMPDPADHYRGQEPVGTFDLAQLDVPSPDDDWLERLIEWADETATTEYEGDAEPADVLAHLVTGTEFHRPPPEQARRWTVADDGSAEWAMGHVLRADLALDRLAAQAQVWRDEATDRLARIDAWFAHGAKRHLATKAFMQAHLVAYALDQREADPKHAKTLMLPSGVVKTIETKPKVGVDDEVTVVAWAEQVLGKLDTSWLNEVAPEQPRKLYVQPLRDHTSVVEVVDHARLVLANSAEMVEWATAEYLARHGGHDMAPEVAVSRARCPQPGDGWPNPTDATDLVARVEVLVSHLEVHGPDGQPVPGTHVEPGGVTAKVVPAP